MASLDELITRRKQRLGETQPINNTQPIAQQPTQAQPATTLDLFKQRRMEQQAQQAVQPTQPVVQQTMTEKLEANKNIKDPSKRNYLTSPAEIYQLAAEQGRISARDRKSVV